MGHLHVFCLLSFVSLYAALAQATLIEQTWVVDYKFVAPDGVEKAVPVVNQQLPGPALRGRVGDRVRIRVINRLTSESTSIHWHGVKQLGTPWSDGVPGVTQCAILPGQEFLYQFTLDSPGTLWWHSHSGMQKSSMHGLIVVTGDEDRVGQFGARDVDLVLGDWFHRSGAEMAAGLKQRLPNAFRWVGDAQSILIQGRGMFNCSETTKKCDPNHRDAGPAIIDVDSKSRYRLRIVGASSLSNLNMGIDAHELRVVEAETTLTRPMDVRYLDVGSSNSYSAMITTLSKNELDKVAPGHNGLFWIQANVRHRSKGARGLAILRYSFANRNEKLPTRPPPEDWPARDDVQWSLNQAKALKALSPVTVPPPDRRIVLLGTQNRLTDGSLVWSMNNMSFTSQRTPLMQSAKYNIEEETREWQEAPRIPTPFNYSTTLTASNLSIISKRATHVIRVSKGDVVEIVLQNTVNLGGKEEIHPWHLHLHNFWVVGYGAHHSTWSERDVASYDLTRAVHRNTAILYPQSWTALRFVADNAGLAFFHCHILAHLEMGMGLVLQIGDSWDIPKPPLGTPFCGRMSHGPHAFRHSRAPCGARHAGSCHSK